MPIALQQFPRSGTITVTQGYGGDTSHNVNPWSVDFAAATPVPVLAVASGTVVSIRTGSFRGDNAAGGYGNFVTILHTGGFYATYAHLSSDSVSIGQSVSAGTMIGTSGDTGAVTGPHIHVHFGTGSSGGAINTEGTGDIFRAFGGNDLIPPAFFAGFFGSNQVGAHVDVNNASSILATDIFGTAGNDGETGVADNFHGTSAANRMFGGAGNDVLSGLGGDDLLVGGTGVDTFDGGTGNDTISTTYSASNWTVNFATGIASADGLNETFVNVENFILGSGGDIVTMATGSTNNTIDTGSGADQVNLTYNFGSGYTVSGTANALVISGSAGTDTFIGVETFAFANGVTRTAAQLLPTSSPADLVIDALSVINSTVQEDTGLSLEAIIRNQGGVTTGSFVTRLYLSTNPTFDASDWLLTEFTTNSLAAGQTMSFGQSVPLPGAAGPGQYYLIVWADYNNQITESSDANNSTNIPITITAASTTLTGQAIVDEALTHLGEEYYWSQRPNGTFVIADYDNASYGAGANGGWDCAEFVSYCAFQVYGLQVGLAGGPNGDVNGLVNGFQNEANSSYWIRDAANAGLVQVISLADARNIPGAILIAQGSGSEPGHVAISLGDGRIVHATAPLVGGFYLSDGGIQRAPQGNGLPPTQVDVGDVEISSSFNWSSTAYVAILLDAVTYTNNPTPTAPEIAVTGNGVNIVDGDSSPSSGDHTNFGSVVLGGAPITRVFTVTNTGTATLTLSGLSLPSGFSVVNGLVSSLAPGASDTFTVQLNTTTAGTWQGNISFTNNDSNENPFNFQISGTVTTPSTDLTASGLNVTLTTLSGAPALAVNFQINNVGPNAASASASYVYLSADSTITSSDIFLGFIDTPSVINANSSINNDATWNVPTGLSGTYFVGVIADGAGEIAETNETNNLSNVVQINLPTSGGQPDLYANNISGTPTSLQAGLSSSLFYNMGNAGTVSAPASVTGIYLSTDNVITTADILIGTSAVGAIAANTALSAINVGFTLPTSVAAGTYFIGAIVDYNGNITESSESNNVSNVVSITVTPGSGDAGGTFETALPVTATSWNGTVGVGTDTADFYVFQAPTTGVITLTLSGLQNDVDLFFYDANHNQLDSSSNEGVANDVVTANVVAGQSYYVQLLPFTGSSTYDVHYTIAAAQPPNANADFAGDGVSDFFLRSASTGAMVMWFNASSANAAGLGTVATNWATNGFGDFNGDGRDDILWRNTTTGDMAMWFMNGQAVTGSAGFGVGTAWSISGIGDVNGDNRDDIVWRNSNGDLILWFMDGSSITGAGLGNVSPNWVIETLGDFNGDGRDDFIWRNTSTGDMSMWLMNGASAAPSSFANVGAPWNIAGVGDLNGDGRDDVIWRNSSTGAVSLWFMDGGSITSSTGLGVGAAWDVATVGDYNGDGRDDIIWRNTSTNDVIAWYMNGGAVQSSAFLGNISSDWIINPGG